MRVFGRFGASPPHVCSVALTAQPLMAQDLPLPLPIHASPTRPYSAPGRRVVDIENLRVVPAARFPNDVPTCQVLVVGGGLGGVAAAEDLARQGVSVILTEPTSHLGGQLTAQGLSVPDENSFIEQDPGPGTRHYGELRDQVRLFYALTPGIVTGRGGERRPVLGQPRLRRAGRLGAGHPGPARAAGRAVRHPPDLPAPPAPRCPALPRQRRIQLCRLPGPGHGPHHPRSARRSCWMPPRPATRWPWPVRPGPSGRRRRAPTASRTRRRTPTRSGCRASPTISPSAGRRRGHTRSSPKPAEYDFFKSLGEYTLAYDYPDPRGPGGLPDVRPRARCGRPVLDLPPPRRRLLLHRQPAPMPRTSPLINWRGNDFREESFVGQTPEEQVRILRRGEGVRAGVFVLAPDRVPARRGRDRLPRDSAGGGHAGRGRLRAVPLRPRVAPPAGRVAR